MEFWPWIKRWRCSLFGLLMILSMSADGISPDYSGDVSSFRGRPGIKTGRRLNSCAPGSMVPMPCKQMLSTGLTKIYAKVNLDGGKWFYLYI